MITQIVATTTRIDDATVQSAPTVSLGQTTCPVRTEDRVCPDPIWRSNPAAPLRLRTHAQLRATCGVLWRAWSDGVVPLRVELVALDIEARHLLVANLDPLRIAPRVQPGFKWSSQHLERGGCDGCSEAAFGSVWAKRVALAWSALCCATRGSASVLGGDRDRMLE